MRTLGKICPKIPEFVELCVMKIGSVSVFQGLSVQLSVCLVSDRSVAKRTGHCPWQRQSDVRDVDGDGAGTGGGV